MAGKSLKGTKSHENLKEAFAGESQANRRYLYFARVADIEGFPDMAGLFKDTADAETGHAFGHLDFLAIIGDPVTGEPVVEAGQWSRPPAFADGAAGLLSTVDDLLAFARMLLRGGNPVLPADAVTESATA